MRSPAIGFAVVVSLVLVLTPVGRCGAWAQGNGNPAGAQPANQGKGNQQPGADGNQPGGAHNGAGQVNSPGGENTKPDNSGAGGDASGNREGGEQATALKIEAIVPAAPMIEPNEPLVLEGKGFEDGDKVTFTDPSGNQATAEVLKTEQNRMAVIATLGIAGKWTAAVVSADGKLQDQIEFPVFNAPPLELKSPRVYAFGVVAGVATLFLIGITLFVLISIWRAQSAKSPEDRWSLADALSEESVYQPNEIHTKKDVILLASSSRVIALVGLMGILSTVLGMGYAIMWNLTVFGTVPDLTQIRSFLLGSACLFAPYLANQLSGMFTPSTKPAAVPKGGTEHAPSGPAIATIAPAAPAAGAAVQAIHLIGSGFQQGLSVTLTDPTQAQHAVTSADLTAVSDMQVSLNATLNMAGSWKVTVTNAGAAAGVSHDFTVSGPPNVTGLTNAAGLTQGPNAQILTFAGTGFMSGMAVQLTDPGGNVTTLDPKTVTATQTTVSVVLPAEGKWKVVFVNPGNHASQPPLEMPVQAVQH